MSKSVSKSVRIGSESHRFLEQLKRILEMPDSEAGIKVVKSGGVDRESVGPLSVEKESQGC